MNAIIDLVTFRNVAAGVVVYLISLTFYRLTLHPLARFPGPKLAAITRYYEGYYDLVQNGQYTFKIAKLHKEYGPIIRISSYELHINDPVFLETLYRQDAHFDKYAWAVDAFAAKGATLFTAAHSLHKARRQPLSPFFSKAKVAARQDLIQRHLNKFCQRMSAFSNSRATFELGAAMTAFTRDVANEFITGKSYDILDHEDFDIAMLAASQGSGQIWRLTKFVRWFAPAMMAIPIDWVMKIASEDMKVFFRHIKETMQDTQNLMTAIASPTPNDKAPRTIVHEIMGSKLPPSEKTHDRIFQDVSTVSGAGFETTASALRLIFFHVFSNADILQRLRDELASAGASSSDQLDLKTLEQLPYLTAILMEGMRLSPAIATRMARIAPNTGLVYDKWHIPADTPVGMTILLLHMNETLYPEPKRFNPDRWMDPDVRREAERGFAPFSRGTRNCLGMYLAWAEMYKAVAVLAQRFDFWFEGARAEDFECNSDQFALGTKGKGTLRATATVR
ncbi:trichodiene oxygenase [Massariosphaeria phaeospora]|uniref:Trichodiene oxygenase n=1 Tax=Massariosphaeria phaeospora TaxID=100035 RepID=A0A7C8IEZ2_9PLEO|nr:trichodiene oxygenase [Massariosphaeria phaeospora]